MSQYNKLSDIQYARFWSAGIPTMYNTVVITGSVSQSARMVRFMCSKYLRAPLHCIMQYRHTSPSDLYNYNA